MKLGWRVTASACVLTFVLGSVHAFSVFLTPLEEAFDATRAQVSLTYSLALISITATVSFGHVLYPRVAAWGVALAVGVISAAGAAIAGTAGSIEGIWLGYGVIFGLANGLGYGYGLQTAGQANPGREGLAMGLVTAAYALGAMVFSPAFALALEAGGFPAAMFALCFAALLCCAVSALIFRREGTRYLTSEEATSVLRVHGLAPLWLGYTCAVFAGLMAIGHATGIAGTYGTPAEVLIVAPVLIALCNMGGSLTGGWLTDLLPTPFLFAGLPLISAGVLAALASGAVPWVLLAIGLTGLIYGAVISVYPAVIARRYGTAGPRVYGIIFSGWAVAGLCGPWLAGGLFDHYGNYSLALGIAAGLALVSAGTAFFSTPAGNYGGGT